MLLNCNGYLNVKCEFVIEKVLFAFDKMDALGNYFRKNACFVKKKLYLCKRKGLRHWLR